MEIKFLERIWKQMLLMFAVLLITASIALAQDIPCPVPLRELVLIDPKVFYHERIVDRLPRDARVVFLSGDTTGMDQITRILAREKDIQVLRIFSHGSPGKLFLTGEVIDSRTLARYRQTLSTWSRAFTHDADILLYGCSVADTEKGGAFVNRLAQYTGADVAASTNRTGGPENQWALEYRTGDIEAAFLAVEDYPYYLENQVVANNNDSGAGSLREAIANVGDGGEITFNGNYTITLSTPLTIDRDITMTITGTGAGSTVIDGNDAVQVFNITSGDTVVLLGLTIQNGFNAEEGGGISNAGDLTLDTCTVSGNISERQDADSKGGGIYNAGTLTIYDSTIKDNRVTTDVDSANNDFISTGGGICNNGTLTINNSTISGNTASITGSGSDSLYYHAKGGGIYNSNTLNINNSTISGNTAQNDCTHDSGTNNTYGGGICIDTGSDATISNSTISQNTVNAEEGNDNIHIGAGILLRGGTLTVRNTIMAQNVDKSSNYDYYYSGGTLTDDGYNVVEYQNLSSIDANDGMAFNVTTDILYNTIVGTNTTVHAHWNQNGSDFDGSLNLSSTLADNGGPTQTLAFTGESFAIDAIPYSAGADTWNNSPITGGNYYDQRGEETTAGNPISIGAYSEPPSTLLYYMAKSSGNWSAYGTVWFTSATESTDPADYTTQATEAPNAANSAGIIINDDIDVTVAAGGFSIDQVTVDTGASITINSGQTVTLSDGTGNDLTVDGTGTVDVNGILDASAGQMVFTGAGTLNLVQASFSVNSFSAGSSTVTLDGGVAQTIGSDMALYNLTLAENTVLATTHNITVSGATSGTGTANATGGTFTYNGSGDQSIFQGTYCWVALSGSGTKSFSGTTTSTSGITVSGSMTIAGDGASTTTVQGCGFEGATRSSVFIVESGNTVTIEDMTVTYGKTASNGAGIHNLGILTINDCTISGNVTTSGCGGGIDCHRDGRLTINNSTVYENTAEWGAGVCNYGTGSSFTNTTITGNTSNREGGGVLLDVGTLTMDSCTVAHNHSDYDASGDEKGGGIYLWTGALNVQNTIIAYNIRGNDAGTTGDDYYYNNGTLTDNGYNVVKIQDGTSNQFAGPTDWLWSSANSRYEKGGSSTTDYGLLYLSSSLADNGGPTETLAITSASSIAVANGNTSETTDQRGATRKSPPTIGAYEYFADYRTDSGAGTSWGTASNWEIDRGLGSWDEAVDPPEADNSTAISVRRSMEVDTNVSIDQTTVDAGATLTIDDTYKLTVENGAGDDLTLQGDLTNAGTNSTFTCAAGATVVCSGVSNTTLSGAGTWTFKTLTLNKDAAATLDINTDSNVTVETALTVTQGTVDLGTWEHDLRLGGALTIDANGRWTAHGDTSTHYVQFYGADCTFRDNSTGDPHPQNLGHVKVDD